VLLLSSLIHSVLILIFIQIDQTYNDCSYVPNPVLVIIDVEPKELGIPTKAYYAVEEVKEVEVMSFISVIEIFILFTYIIAKVFLLYMMVGRELVFAHH